MKKLVFLLTLVAFMIPAGFAAQAGYDGNRDSLRQGWTSVKSDQKKAAAAEQAIADQAKVALSTPKAKGKKQPR